jgi:TonB family protein
MAKMNKIGLGILGMAFMSFSVHSLFAQPLIPKRIVGMDYPHLARAARIEGKVEVVCTLKADGSVASTRVNEEAHPILADAAKENASMWIFMADTDKSQLSQSITLIYSFKMQYKVPQPMDATAPYHRPARQFVFEYPSSVKINSEYCSLNSSCF